MTRAGGGPPAPRAEWAYFLDLDGTLLDFTDAPGAARFDDALRGLIGALFKKTGGAVALISGRALADIDRMLDGVHLPAAGQHGTERRDARGRITRHTFPLERLEWAHARLAGAAAGHAGLLVEHKGLSLALHYRRAPRLGGYAHRLARSLAPRLGAQFCIQPGKRIVEVKPAGKDKGAAVVEFMAEEPFRGRTPVFVGDDLTDEFAFRAVNRLGGYSIKVGAGHTAARWRLRDVRAVRQWFDPARVS
ncbi:MAG TPA: trehalose-phosphatase [Gemmatimonadales bacterium]|nr:trehalose-phosphatase [Gemmatimonadales bacterium]